MDERMQRLLMRAAPLVIGLLAAGFFVVKGCQEGPFGRKQVVALNAQQEAQLGAQAFQEVLSQSRVVENGQIVADVDDVVRRLAAATEDPNFLKATGLKPQRFAWEVRVVNSQEMNAFCLPGGKIVVYTGIVPVAKTKGGLAVVLGHEISHALAHHGAERMAHQKLAEIGVSAAGASLGDLDPNDRARVMQVLNAGAKFGILKYSRSHESEADHLGLYLMAAAGYNPEEAIHFWERMQQFSGGQKTPEFLSTHPSHETRIRDLASWVPEVMPLYEAARQRQGPARRPAGAGR